MIRIVKMTFKTEKIDEFIAVFENAKPKIEAFPGCTKVDLIQDINDPRIIMTQSIWDGPEALEAYRKSELFNSTWAKTKVLFDDKPQAWSVEKIS
jgi:quinol monooxygenase YgiN